jgi:hypothetical protein
LRSVPSARSFVVAAAKKKPAVALFRGPHLRVRFWAADLVAAADAGNPTVSVPDDFHAAISVLAVALIDIGSARPAPIWLIVASVISGTNAYSHAAARACAHVHILCLDW